MVRYILAIIIFLAQIITLPTIALAQQEEPIRHLMLKQFDRPEARLTIAAIAIDDQYAIASWIQDGRGGRALLRNKQGIWVIMLCSGESLKKADRLVKIGMSYELANRLTQLLIKSEAALTTHERYLLDTFEGDIELDGNHHPNLNTHYNAQPK
jgi:hypothetical protein